MRKLQKAVFWFTLISFASANTPQKHLTPGISLDGETVRFGSGVSRYVLQDLQPKTGYEVRVSYSATVPSKVHLKLISTVHKNLHRYRRSLLDTEKLILHTNNTGKDYYVLELQAEAVGIHRDGPGALPEVFYYNIVLAQLIFGIPIEALPVAGLVVISLVAVWLLLPWWMRTAVPAILNFMEGSQEAKAAKHSR